MIYNIWSALPDQEWSFKNHKNAFLNDPKGQKIVFGHFKDFVALTNFLALFYR